jgi:hypothetical protein
MLKIFRGLRPLAPARGSAPGPRWGLRPQTPAGGARSAALRAAELAHHEGPQIKIPGGPLEPLLRHWISGIWRVRPGSPVFSEDLKLG